MTDDPIRPLQAFLEQLNRWRRAHRAGDEAYAEMSSVAVTTLTQARNAMRRAGEV